jgi:hypothetical protein
MPLNYLFPESVARKSGEGPAVEAGGFRGKLAVATLGITRTLEQAGLEVSIWGSSGQQDWSEQPLARFPRKFYCGLYSILLNLSPYPRICYLKVRWKMSRGDRRETLPLFGFYVFVEESGARLRPAVEQKSEHALDWASVVA